MKVKFYTFNEENRAKIVFALTEAYIQYGEYTKKAKGIQERILPMEGAGSFITIDELSNVTAESRLYLSGRIEARCCDYEAAIDHFKEVHSYVDIRRSYSGINMKEDREEYCVDPGVVLLQ